MTCRKDTGRLAFSTKTKRDGPRAGDVYVYPLQLLGLDRVGCEAVITAAGLPSPGLSSCVFCAAMHPDEIDALHPEELWLIVILEAHAQINLKKIRGLWGHGERMTEYIHGANCCRQPWSPKYGPNGQPWSGRLNYVTIQKRSPTWCCLLRYAGWRLCEANAGHGVRLVVSPDPQHPLR